MADEKDVKPDDDRKDADEKMPAWAKALCDRMDSLEKRDSKKADSEEEKKKPEAKKDDDDDSKKADAAVDMPADPMPGAVADKKDDDDDTKKADAETKAELAEVRRELAVLRGQVPRNLSAADRSEITAAQARADSIAANFGQRAEAPMGNETPSAYRRRLAQQFQKHSKQFSGLSIESMDQKTFDAIEGLIYADADAASRNVQDIGEGQLREVVKTDATGRRITSFIGDPAACWGDFQLGKRRVAHINKQ